MREYQEMAAKYDVFPAPAGCGGVEVEVGSAAMMAKVLGLAGEAGEVCEKFKKILRDKGGKMSEADREAVVRELGDVLWYMTTIGRYMGVGLDEIAKGNIEKLAGRERRGVIHGGGDDR